MSRRNQVRRRRNYGRRQHEVRERRPDQIAEHGSVARSDDFAWSAIDVDEPGHVGSDAFLGYER